MPLTAEQHSAMAPAVRFFYLNASMFGVPVQGYHRFADGVASMTVKAAGLVPVVTASGDEMTRSETVTLFNDMCVMAPATLIDDRITWTVKGPDRVGARFTHAGRSIDAALVFNEAGELVDFISDDRAQAAGDGSTMTRRRWSTPLQAYRAFAGGRLASRAEARWHDEQGDYAYLELTIDEVRYNVRR